MVSFCIFLVTPLDVVKIRLQAQKNPFPKGTMNMGMTYIGLVLCFIGPRSTVNVRWPHSCFQYLGKCFVYCNGLMDHICVCENGNSKAWYKAPGHFNGTLVKNFTYLLLFTIMLYKSVQSAVPFALVSDRAYFCFCKAELLSLIMIKTSDCQPSHLPTLTLHYVLCRMPSSRLYAVRE